MTVIYAFYLWDGVASEKSGTILESKIIIENVEYRSKNTFNTVLKYILYRFVVKFVGQMSRWSLKMYAKISFVAYK